jgi:hypothetical protein
MHDSAHIEALKTGGRCDRLFVVVGLTVTAMTEKLKHVPPRVSEVDHGLHSCCCDGSFRRVLHAAGHGEVQT